MVNRTDDLLGFVRLSKAPSKSLRNLKGALMMLAFLATTLLVATQISAQNVPHVAGVDPAEGKANDSVTMSGENLGKESVSAVFLSDDKSDYKGTIVDQATDKITMKVPQVKGGNYNLSIQVGDKILILPVRFKVNE